MICAVRNYNYRFQEKNSNLDRDLEFRGSNSGPDSNFYLELKKSFLLVWRYHQLLSGFLANAHLPRVSR